MKRTEENLLYMQLYDSYKNLILTGMLKPGTKLPSVRQCASTRQLSRTTVEMAYMLLAADGYILSKPQSGFYVTDMWSERPAGEKKKVPDKDERSKLNKQEIRVDFSNTASGQESFDLERWRRYIKSALRQGDRLLSYGDVQGEPDLREALCEYLVKTRNVVCSPESIVIGAGFQSLLHILCPLIRGERQVYLSDQSFVKGRAVFEDYGFQITDEPENDGLWYVTPSHKNRVCEVMDLKERYELLAKAKSRGMLVIEDDYDSEFISQSHPAPALQGLAGGENVVYLGTFSRVLLPSIRISFMILPAAMMERYEKRKQLYNQTVSKADQIALCQFIRDGHLVYQIRKTKKAYEEENQKFFGEVKAALKDIPGIRVLRSGLVIKVELPVGEEEKRKAEFESEKKAEAAESENTAGETTEAARPEHTAGEAAEAATTRSEAVKCETKAAATLKKSICLTTLSQSLLKQGIRIGLDENEEASSFYLSEGGVKEEKRLEALQVIARTMKKMLQDEKSKIRG